MSEDALRVLGFAMRTLTDLPVSAEEDIESDLIFIGVAGMIDPPRKEVAESVRICREAGYPYDYDHRRPQGNRSGNSERAGYLQRRQYRDFRR